LIVNAEIIHIKNAITKAGNPTKIVELKTDHPEKQWRWVSEWVNPPTKATHFVDRWWGLINLTGDWESLTAHPKGYELIGVKFAVELVWDDKFDKPKINVFFKGAATTETSVPTNGFAPPPTSGFAPPPSTPISQVVPDDDIPF